MFLKGFAFALFGYYSDSEAIVLLFIE